MRQGVVTFEFDREPLAQFPGHGTCFIGHPTPLESMIKTDLELEALRWAAEPENHGCKNRRTGVLRGAVPSAATVHAGVTGERPLPGPARRAPNDRVYQRLRLAL